MATRKSRFTEEQSRTRSDRRDRNSRHRGVPGDGDNRADLLSLQEEVLGGWQCTRSAGSSCSRKRTAGTPRGAACGRGS